MSYVIEAKYNEQWLFPPTLEELLGKDHPARMVREFVDELDLRGLGFQIREPGDGRPPYGTRLLLRAWLYGYMIKIRSTRGLERGCMDQIGLLWLTGMERPDHTTLWRFWRDNRQVVGKVFKRLLRVAVEMELVGLALHAVDGTKVLSQASEQKAWRRGKLEKRLKQLDEAVEEILEQTERESRKEEAESRLPESLQERQALREKIQERLKKLDEIERDNFQPGDEDARVMKSGSAKKFGYNAQAVVDAESKLIVAADVVNEESDNHLLTPMIGQVEENLGKVAEQTAADAGYKAISGLAEAEAKNYPVMVNEGPEGGPYHASKFVYDEPNDQCVCPRGERLSFDTVKPREKARPYEVRVYRCGQYESCPVRWQCSSSKTGRTVQIHPDYAALKRQREKMKDPAMRALLKKRGQTVEPVFGWAKEGMGFRRWTVRGLPKVRAQWLFLCTSLNLIRLYKPWVEGRIVFA